MNDIQIYNLKALHLLWAVIFFVALYLYDAKQRKAAIARFAVLKNVYLANLPGMSQQTASPAKRFGKACCLLTGLVFIVIALCRPAWNLKETTIKRSGRDIVYAIDVSRSMLAEDLAPNRLERAKIAIADSVAKLQGDRVALVAFAGNAVVKCPLTVDYGFFRMILETISTDSVSRGGTMIGDAIRTITDQVFDGQEKMFKDIILITDGEDQESFPVEAAKAAGDKGIRLIIIGLGDENEGQRIPITNSSGVKSFLKYQGKEVWTRLNADSLRQMATATPGGRYLPVAIGNIDLGEVYMDLIAGADKKELEEKTIKRYEEKFQIFLAIGLLLVAIEAIISSRRKTTALPLMIILTLLLCSPNHAEAASTRSLVKSGNKAYQAEQYDEALAAYEQAATQDQESPYVQFNRGNALYQKGDYQGALAAYEQAAAQNKDEELAAHAKYNLGNAVFQIAEQNKDNPQQAITDYLNSVEHYQQAMAIDPQMQEAARNLEIARMRINQTREKLKQDEKMRQEMKDKLQQMLDKQEEMAEKSQELTDDKKEGKEQQNSEQKAKQEAGKQEQLQQEAADTSEKMTENKSFDQAREHLDQAAKEQEKATENLQKNDPAAAHDNQQAAIDELQKSLESLDKDDDKKEKGDQGQEKEQDKNKQTEKKSDPGQDGKQEQEQQQQDTSPPDNQPGEQPDKTKTENLDAVPPDKTAQEILNREKQNKQERQLQQTFGVEPVERDW
ncbi:MAG: VWA domain-containing protein [Proteobacteria bacterium]|nr:VWA domain-containing protein [Pseudomonadota bacterium]MBU1716575.1 VWA domain-containing protein [Pseudomonadota bacterium]